MLKFVDYLFIDLKHMNPEKHVEFAGVHNDIILRNTLLAASVLKSRNKRLIIRQVVIPGINDGSNIAELAGFLASLSFLSGVELLAYHDYGAHKYGLLGRTYSLTGQKPPTPQEMTGCREVLEKRGLTVI